jgi:SAM-dependent methyltransferase
MSQSMLAYVVNARVLNKSPLRAYLRLNEWVWRRLNPSITSVSPLRLYGRFLHLLARLQSDRRQYFGTMFLRNRPALEQMIRIAAQRPNGASLNIAVIGCSNGCEVYSILWTLRRARPDLHITVHAGDIAPQIVEVAKHGAYSVRAPELVKSPIFERLTPGEMSGMFDREEDYARIKPWLQSGIVWHVVDAMAPDLVAQLGRHDIVVANNFLCHMLPDVARRCLRNVVGLVKPGGHLFVSGVDLDVRTSVARELGWEPLEELLEEIHDGDPIVRTGWPFQWSGLEPLDKRKPDWRVRYASVFRIGETTLA